MRSIFLISCVLLFCNIGRTFSQPFVTSTASARQYIAIAEKFQQGAAVNTEDWNILFTTPPYDMMIQGGAIDTSLLKSVMKTVYASGQQLADTTEYHRYHEAYKSRLSDIRKHLDRVEQAGFKDSIVALVDPHLPDRLKSGISDLQFYYTVYGSEEATGMFGMVLNDALLTYKADSFRAGLISAHETIHAIVSISFQGKLKPDVDYNSREFALLYFLQSVLEEGVADLIDKESLSQEGSPLRKRVAELTANDEQLSTAYIKRLDSLLTAAQKDETLAFSEFSNPSELAGYLGQNGGHVPGRYMVNVIRRAGYLSELIENIDKPLSLLLSYKKATDGRPAYPQISDASVQWLTTLQNRLMKP